MHGSRMSPIDWHQGTGRSKRPALATRPFLNPNAWICFWSAIAFAGLAGLVVLLPTLVEHRGWLQLNSLLIAITGIGLHRFLQVTVFAEPESDQNNRLQSTIIDINRLERLT